MPADGNASPELNTFADRLNHLFAMARPRGEDREYTAKEVVHGMVEAGFDISASHLSELRRGIKNNPSLRVMTGLAAFFAVPPAYLLGEPAVEHEVSAELELRRAMSDAQVHELATRAADLAPAQRTAMLRLLADIVREHGD